MVSLPPLAATTQGTEPLARLATNKGFVITAEPGIYFIEALLRDPGLRRRAGHSSPAL